MLWGLQELRTLIQDIINELNKNEIDLGRFGDFQQNLLYGQNWIFDPFLKICFCYVIKDFHEIQVLKFL